MLFPKKKNWNGKIKMDSDRDKDLEEFFIWNTKTENIKGESIAFKKKIYTLRKNEK